MKIDFSGITYINNPNKRLLFKFIKYYYFPDGESETNKLIFDRMKVELKFPEDYINDIDVLDRKYGFLYFNGNFIDGTMEFLKIMNDFDMIYQLFINYSSYFAETDLNKLKYSFIFFDDLIKNFEMGYNFFYGLNDDHKNIEVGTDIMKNYLDELLQLPKTKEYDKLNRSDIEVIKKQILLNAYYFWFDFYERFKDDFHIIEERSNECGYTCCAGNKDKKHTNDNEKCCKDSLNELKYSTNDITQIITEITKSLFKLHRN